MKKLIPALIAASFFAAPAFAATHQRVKHPAMREEMSTRVDPFYAEPVNPYKASDTIIAHVFGVPS